MLEYWFMFPLSVLFSLLAMTFGVGGAALFTPFFSLVLSLPATIAVGVSLFIEIFGFASGLNGYARKKLINYDLGVKFLVYTVPGAIIGAVFAGFLPEWLVLGSLSMLLFFLAVYILKPGKQILRKDMNHAFLDPGPNNKERIPLQPGTGVLATVGGTLAGLVSVGLGEMNDYLFLRIYNMRGAIAAGTSVFVLSVTVLVGAFAHGFVFVSQHMHLFPRVLGILLFAVPGVVIGAQLGVLLSQRLDDELRERYLAVLFLIIAVVTVMAMLK